MTSDENEARSVTRAITAVALCVACIAARTGVSKARVEDILATIGQTVRITRSVVVCDGCLLTREVFRLSRSDDHRDHPYPYRDPSDEPRGDAPPPSARSGP